MLRLNYIQFVSFIISSESEGGLFFLSYITIITGIIKWWNPIQMLLNTLVSCRISACNIYYWVGRRHPKSTKNHQITSNLPKIILCFFLFYAIFIEESGKTMKMIQDIHAIIPVIPKLLQQFCKGPNWLFFLCRGTTLKKYRPFFYKKLVFIKNLCY